MEEQTTNENWRDEVSGESAPTLKIADGETVTFKFLDEGEKRSHPDFGTSVVFKIIREDQEFSWYVNAQNFNLLGQIKDLGTVIDKVVKVNRTGSKKSDTRYTIVLA